MVEKGKRRGITPGMVYCISCVRCEVERNFCRETVGGTKANVRLLGGGEKKQGKEGLFQGARVTWSVGSY